MPRKARILFSLWLVATAGAALRAERNEDTQRPIFRADADLVSLDVTVTDKNRKPVDGLTKDDFLVYEDKTQQNIAFFSHEQKPVSWGLVLDRSGSMTGMMEEVYRAALHSIEAGTPEDDTLIITFSDQPRLVQPFTSERLALLESIKGLMAGGGTALYDAVALGLDHVRGGRHKKKVLVVVTDGEDNESLISFHDLVKMARQRETLIYVVGFFGPMGGLELEAYRDHDRLKRLAEDTGAMAYFPKNMEQCINACRDIALQVSQQFSVGYYPSNTNWDGKWREIKIELRSAKDRFVRTRKGYFATELQSKE